MSDRFWDVFVYSYLEGAGGVCLLGGLTAIVGLFAGLLAKAHILPEACAKTAPGLQRLTTSVLVAQQLGGALMILYTLRGRQGDDGLSSGWYLVVAIAIFGLTIGYWPWTDAFKNREPKLALKFFGLSFALPGVVLFVCFLIASHFRPWVD